MSDHFQNYVVATEPQEGQDGFTEITKKRWNPFAEHKGRSVNRMFRSEFAFMPLTDEILEDSFREIETAAVADFVKKSLHA